ncbi:MAG: Long-chain-fatty-acid--CoA ligase [Candidatus Heimdallarchaeota archaeon LC_2]|nr:MAG: Long-chain-fatty-acid--CoA ligase [Candidatus Heimdallarchaeota archaeon LC_2]
MVKTTSLNLASLLDGSARQYGDKIAVIYNETRLTYSQLNAMANQIANGLKAKGYGKGDNIALSCLNLPYFPIVYYAILKIGATVVPLSVLLKRREVKYHLTDSNAKAYFCFVGTQDLPMGEEGWAGFNEVDSCNNFWLITPPGVNSPISGAETMASLMKDQLPTFESEITQADDTAVILYTSGTTGQSKGAELTHMNMFNNAMISNIISYSTHEDILLITLPMFHSFGQTVQMNAGIMGGNTLVLIAKFDPAAVLSSMEKENVSLFAGVPTMYWALLNYPDADKFNLQKIASNLRLGASGGAAIPVEVMKGFENKFSVQILEGYGLSETSPVACFTRLSMKKKFGSIGVPVVGTEMMVSDENGKSVDINEIGEILIKGHHVMKGYYNRPEATAETFTSDGWFKTGDLGKVDEDGYYYIVDRVKEMIIRGGYNVYPREVEEMMITHPAISLVAVVGEPSESHGEEIVAYVVLKANQNGSPDEIIEWCRNEMAAYKYPRKVIIKDELPMTATGKIFKRILTEEAS